MIATSTRSYWDTLQQQVRHTRTGVVLMCVYLCGILSSVKLCVLILRFVVVFAQLYKGAKGAKGAAMPQT